MTGSIPAAVIRNLAHSHSINFVKPNKTLVFVFVTESADIVSGGLVIITGQTGAGKSVLLGSIALVLGGKADASIIGESADNCVVEAEFDIDAKDSAMRRLLEENDVEWDDGEDHFDEGDDEWNNHKARSGSRPHHRDWDDGEDHFDEGDDEWEDGEP